MENYRPFCERVLKRASQIATAKFGKVRRRIKKHDRYQILTEADLAVGEFIIKEIARAYPNYNIVDEERGVIDKKSRFTWVVDPIDGTSNFAVGLPTYGIMFGLLDKSEPVAGGVALPFFREIYFAQKGRGTWCGSRKLNVALSRDPKTQLMSFSVNTHGATPKFRKKFRQVLDRVEPQFLGICASASVFDAIMLVKGQVAGEIFQGGKIWDHVTEQILVQEAGGVYTDFYGRPLDYSDPVSKADTRYTLCAATPYFHKKLQKMIHEK